MCHPSSLLPSPSSFSFSLLPPPAVSPRSRPPTQHSSFKPDTGKLLVLLKHPKDLYTLLVELLDNGIWQTGFTQVCACALIFFGACYFFCFVWRTSNNFYCLTEKNTLFLRGRNLGIFLH